MGEESRPANYQNFPLPGFECLVTMERLLRRADREAEGARLLSEYAPKGHLGFESPALRQIVQPALPARAGFLLLMSRLSAAFPFAITLPSYLEILVDRWEKERHYK